ncbi:hypothetical protein ACS0TY_016195 [Phlomoides rotata]
MELVRSVPRHLPRELYGHLLHRCTDGGLSRQAKQLHARLIPSSTAADDFLASKLIDAYSETNDLTYARHVFDQIPHNNTLAYNSLLIAYSAHNHHSEALKLFGSCFSRRDHYWDMGDLNSDSSNLSCVLRAMAEVALDGPRLARMIHCYAIKTGLDWDVSVPDGLVTYYSRCGDVVSARYLFDEMPVRDLVSWNSLISGYSEVGCFEECRNLYKRMLDMEDGVRPDSFTLSCLLKAMAEKTSGGPHSARMIHCYATTSGFDSDVSVGSLVTCYSRCGDVVTARALFDKMPVKDLASWNSMISGYSQGGFHEECKNLYRKILDSDDVRPNGATVLSALQSCARAADVVFAMEVYQHMISNGIAIDISLCNSIIGVFAKCGSLDCAGELFKEISNNEITYNTIISGYMNHGHVDVAMKIFRQMRNPELDSWNAVLSGVVQNKRYDKVLNLVQEMQLFGYKPNSKTLSSIIPSIEVVSHLKEIHAYAIKNNHDRSDDVATALIDTYAKLGFITAAHGVFDLTKDIGIVIWTAMVSAYATYGDPNVALRTFDKMLFSNIRPVAATFTAVLKACGEGGLFDAAEEIYDYLFLKFKIQPSDTDYASLVMCLCRSGKLEGAVEFVKELPVEPSAEVLGALLRGASEHGDVNLTQFVCRHLLELEPENPSHYVVMANLYAKCRRWEEAAGFRNRLAKMGFVEAAGSISMEAYGGTQGFIEGGEGAGVVELEYAAYA